MNTEKIIEEVKTALTAEEDNRKCFSTPITLSNGLRVASVELHKGKVDALTAEGYKTLDDADDIDWDDWHELLKNI